MRIGLGYRLDVRADREVETYARSFHRELELRGHKVTPIGAGHEIQTPDQLKSDLDFHLDLDNGRDSKGDFAYFRPDHHFKCPTGVWFIDSHGQPTLHKRLSKHYDFVFYAVWFRRELFQNHSDAYWCPNATSTRWFSYRRYKDIVPFKQFGFFGSKGGIDRADPLAEVCRKNGWSFDIRQVAKPFRHKWPGTPEAMATCQHLFNHGQKHDGPNLRIMESMLMNRPLLTDLDPRDGMSKLFTEGYHFIGYESYTYENLEEKCRWVLDNPDKVREIADNGYKEVLRNHTISNRVEHILRRIRD